MCNIQIIKRENYNISNYPDKVIYYSFIGIKEIIFIMFWPSVRSIIGGCEALFNT